MNQIKLILKIIIKKYRENNTKKQIITSSLVHNYNRTHVIFCMYSNALK